MLQRLLGSSFVLLTLLAVACFGGGSDEEKKPGAESSDEAVRLLLVAIEDGDQATIESLIDPEFRDSPAEVGVGNLLRLSELSKLTIEDLEVRSEFSPDNAHARVFVNATVATSAGQASLDDEVLLTSRIEDRWYVTSPNSDYWAAQLRPLPADWTIVQADPNPTLPGTYIPPHPGPDGKLLQGSTDDRAHVSNEAMIPLCTDDQIASGNISTPLCYPSNPPTSGPHAASAAPVRVYTQPVGKEFLVHSMEHGAVVVWYNTTDTNVANRLRAIVDANITRGRLVILTPYAGMEPETIALTAWTRLDKFAVSQFTTDRVQTFIDVHERRFNPEGF